MVNSKKSMRQAIREMMPGDKRRISLADVKYMSVQNTLYQARLEGREYRSRLSEDKSSVIVERIS